MLPISSPGDPVDSSWREDCFGPLQGCCMVTHCSWLHMAMLLLDTGASALAWLLLQDSYSSMDFLSSIESFNTQGLWGFTVCPLHGFPDKRCFVTGKIYKEFPQNFLIFLHSAQSVALCFREIRFLYLCVGTVPLIFLTLLQDCITISKINTYIAPRCGWWSGNCHKQ